MQLTTQTNQMKNPKEIPFEVSVPLMYYIDDNGKYIFDDEEMHATLDERLNEISLTINGLDLRSLN